MTPMRPVRALFIGLAFLGILWAAPTTAAEVQEPRWGFSTDLGLWSGTTNDTTFALGFGLDYYMDQNFSFGGMALFTPVGDLTQIGIAGVAKYHLRLNSGFNLVPFAGLGILHADLNRGSGATKVDRNDTSHFIPLAKNRLLDHPHGKPAPHHPLATRPERQHQRGTPLRYPLGAVTRPQ